MKKIEDYVEYRDGNLWWIKRPNNSTKMGNPVGHRCKGHLWFRFNGDFLAVHRVIYEMFNGKIPEGCEIDHINRIKDDNNIENLRAVTHQVNMQNVHPRRNSKSGIRNVCWDKSRNRWKVEVKVGGMTKYIGRYSDLELAELVAIEARSKYYPCAPEPEPYHETPE